DPSPHGRILLLVSLRNSFHREGQQNSVMPSLCSNNIKSLSESWTRFKDLLHKVPHHRIDHWLIIQIFYDHVSFHLKCEIDHSDSYKLRDKKADEYLEIIKNLTLYDLERWNDSKGFVKPVKAISTSQGTLKTPDQRLLDLEDQINFLLKGLRPTFKPSSTHVPQAYVEAEHTTSRAPEKVLIIEEAKSSFTKDVHSISLTREKSDKDEVASSDDIKKINGSNMEMLVKEAETKNGAENGIQMS
nr:zinc finger, CCHC-type [Tanacetum cinerariifolium]